MLVAADVDDPISPSTLLLQEEAHLTQREPPANSNNAYRELLVQNGLVISGTSPSGHLVEIIEVEDHPWYVGVQFHPELKSRPTNPHPLFRDFVGAAVSHKK